MKLEQKIGSMAIVTDRGVFDNRIANTSKIGTKVQQVARQACSLTCHAHHSSLISHPISSSYRYPSSLRPVMPCHHAHRPPRDDRDKLSCPVVVLSGRRPGAVDADRAAWVCEALGHDWAAFALNSIDCWRQISTFLYRQRDSILNPYCEEKYPWIQAGAFTCCFEMRR